MIRLAQPQDAAGIARVHVRSWQQAYRDLIPADHLTSLDATLDRRTELWRDSIDKGEPQVFVALEGEQVVGWIASGQSRDEDTKPGMGGEVQALYVLAEHWGSGVGRTLWLTARQHLVDHGFRSVTLWVLAQNDRAIRFYRNAGFSPEDASVRTISRGEWTLEEIRYRLNL
ncbi:GNAT family N-acetyltransferase [Pseudomonas bohemica]|uniref:GNAT family N-acetyltransferase n=1 Tax=Pseudomonas bohemica TaxID=2044872 RepID=UPI000DA60246|nr:GNAT family N-acetyltransferase [Pseudomonas bohemica]